MLKPLCMYTEIEQWQMLETRFFFFVCLFVFSLLELEVIDKQGEKARMIHEILNQMSLESYSAGM